MQQKLPGVPRQVEDGLVQTEGCWSLNGGQSGVVRSSRGGAGLRVRQPEDRLTDRETGERQVSVYEHIKVVPLGSSNRNVRLYPSCGVDIQS